MRFFSMVIISSLLSVQFEAKADKLFDSTQWRVAGSGQADVIGDGQGSANIYVLISKEPLGPKYLKGATPATDAFTKACNVRYIVERNETLFLDSTLVPENPQELQDLQALYCDDDAYLSLSDVTREGLSEIIVATFLMDGSDTKGLSSSAMYYHVLRFNKQTMQFEDIVPGFEKRSQALIGGMLLNARDISFFEKTNNSSTYVNKISKDWFTLMQIESGDLGKKRFDLAYYLWNGKAFEKKESRSCRGLYDGDRDWYRPTPEQLLACVEKNTSSKVR